MSKQKKTFLSDIKTLRARARNHLDHGALGSNYVGDVKNTIAILQAVLATEIVCVLRYSQHAIAAYGISSEGVKAEFAEHAKEEMGHAHRWPSASTSWAASPTSIRKAC